MGRRRKREPNRKRTGAWRQVLADNPLTPSGYAIRKTGDAYDDQVNVERERVKTKDWFAKRGVRHP